VIVILTASADTYITNKIVDSLAAVSGNVGQAGTIDIFKLYDESFEVTGANELSRALLRFDYGRLRSLTSSILDLNDMRAVLKLRHISAGQPVPSDFTISVFPITANFSEGLGRNISSYSDISAANFLSSSTNVLWNTPGADASGTLGDTGIDYITRGDLLDGAGVRSLEFKQNFPIGNEDLAIDVTSFLSASMVGILPQPAIRLSLTGSEEQDDITRFVKRFASRHVKDPTLRPSIEVYFDDAVQDTRQSMLFDVTGTLFLTNNVRGVRKNIVSGSSLTQISGDNCLIVDLMTGSFTASFTGSQYSAVEPSVGMYYVNCVIRSNDTRIVTGTTGLSNFISASGSVTFNEKWRSIDGSVVYKESELTFNKNDPGGNVYATDALIAHCSGPQNLPGDRTAVIRAKFFDLASEDTVSKFAIEKKPLQLTSVLYRAFDVNDKSLIFDFDAIGTKASLDENGNFFTVYSDTFPYGRPVTFEFLVEYNGKQTIVSSNGYTFMHGE
jgi:hypothetical protein